jgi:5-methylcytosine-specific restriction enzyme subunit McrC
MISTNSRIYELTEYASKLFPTDLIPMGLGTSLWRGYGEKGSLRKDVVAVEFPSPITGGQWRLTSHGWVGYIPLSDELGFRLQPKVGLANIFGMLEYAYSLKSFQFSSTRNRYNSL